MTHDVIVIGLGGVGSATVRELAIHGVRVLGFDQYTPPHARGSSHGETRVIRKAYFEHPDYVPLLLRAYDLWSGLESEADRELLNRCGLLEIGPPQGTLVPGVLRSAEKFGLRVDRMTIPEVERRFRGIRGYEGWTALFEQDAGFLWVEECITANLQSALKQGAELRLNEKVLGWESFANHVTVATDQRMYVAGALVIACGPWASESLRGVDIPLTVLHKHLYWYRNTPSCYSQTTGFPCYFFESSNGHYYGFPALEGSGLKVARHSGGTIATHPIDGEHQPDREDQQLVESFLADYLPDVDRREMRTKGCYYTMTPDENFIVDHLPDDPKVTVVAGLSGHGFKFASVLGEIAAQLALQQTPGLDFDFLRLSRFI